MMSKDNTQGAPANAGRALAEGDAAGASSSLRDGDPSRKARYILADLADMKVGLVHRRADPLTSEAIVGWRVRIQEGFRGLQFMLAVEEVLHAQAIEARQGGDAVGGSVEDKSAVDEVDVPVKNPPSSPRPDAGEVEGLVKRLTDAAIQVGYEKAMGGDEEEQRALREFVDARTAILSRIRSTPPAGLEGDLIQRAREAAAQISEEDYPNSGLANCIRAGQYDHSCDVRSALRALSTRQTERDQEGRLPDGNSVGEAPDRDAEHLEWAVSRWNAEVANRPIQNIHRRALDTTWRQIIRRFGGDPDALVGPSHDALSAAPRPLSHGKGKVATPTQETPDVQG